MKLVCPACRQPGADDRLVVAPLTGDASAGCDRCGTCGRQYPRVEGIRCVPPDLAAFRAAQGHALRADWLGDPDDAAGLAERCARAASLDPASREFTEAVLPGIYALAHWGGSADLPDLQPELSPNEGLRRLTADWLAEFGAAGREPRTGAALEAGCGPGGMLPVLARARPGGAVGLDVRLSMLRIARRVMACGAAVLPVRVEGKRFMPARIAAPAGAPAGGVAQVVLVQGDVVAPPFEAEAFEVVAAFSLLDSVPDPMFVLGQLDALLAPGGLLILAAPYHWEPQVTPPAAWWSTPQATGAEVLRAALAGRCPLLPHLRYEVQAQADRVPWVLPSHARLIQRYFLDVVLARKSRQGRRG